GDRPEAVERVSDASSSVERPKVLEALAKEGVRRPYVPAVKRDRAEVAEGCRPPLVVSNPPVDPERPFVTGASAIPVALPALDLPEAAERGGSQVVVVGFPDGVETPLEVPTRFGQIGRGQRYPPKPEARHGDGARVAFGRDDPQALFEPFARHAQVLLPPREVGEEAKRPRSHARGHVRGTLERPFDPPPPLRDAPVVRPVVADRDREAQSGVRVVLEQPRIRRPEVVELIGEAVDELGLP